MSVVLRLVSEQN